MKYMTKFDTGRGIPIVFVPKCKLSLSNIVVRVLSTEIFCDDARAGSLYRLVEVERIALFDTSALPRIKFADPISPVKEAIAFGKDGEGYRLRASGRLTLDAFCAVAFALFCKGRIALGESVLLSFDAEAFYAAVTDDGALLFV